MSGATPPAAAPPGAPRAADGGRAVRGVLLPGVPGTAGRPAGREIAAARALRPATAPARVGSILGKLGVSSQLAASAALARARGGRPVRR